MKNLSFKLSPLNLQLPLLLHTKKIRIYYRFNHKLNNDFLENAKVFINAHECTEFAIHESTLLQKILQLVFPV